ILSFLITCSNLLAQKLDVTWIRISNIKSESAKYGEMHEAGPYVLFNARIVNDSKDTLCLKPSSANYSIRYNFEGTSYKKEIIPMPFIDRETVFLAPKDTVEFMAGDDIFLGTDIYKEDKEDFTDELLKSLPTIKLYYIQKDLDIHSESVDNVYIK